jgi:hypothetical protein
MSRATAIAVVYIPLTISLRGYLCDGGAVIVCCYMRRRQAYMRTITCLRAAARWLAEWNPAEVCGAMQQPAAAAWCSISITLNIRDFDHYPAHNRDLSFFFDAGRHPAAVRHPFADRLSIKYQLNLFHGCSLAQ